MSLAIPESAVTLESGWIIKPLNFKVYNYVQSNVYIFLTLHQNFFNFTILWLIFTFPSLSLMALNLFQFQKNRVDSVQLSSRHIPSCCLQFQYTGKELPPPPFSQELQITGVNVSHISIGIPPPKGEW